MTSLKDQIIKAATSMSRPDVERILVTRVLTAKRGCLKLERRRWLLVPAELWREVENQIPRSESTWPGAMTLGLPVEFVPPDTDREREIVTELVESVKRARDLVERSEFDSFPSGT